jgi:8-oxo-dGTP pyrophosphatase MutT (NUDIX family)
MIDNRYLESVITLLHVNNTKCLLQLRDFKPSIAFPGVWSGFGGKLEKGESPKIAGSRELEEELGYSPDQISYFRDYVFDKSVAQQRADLRFKVPISELILTEGQDLGLFSRSEIIERELYSKKLGRKLPIPDVSVKIFLDFFDFISSEQRDPSK